jgi:hypothetical protein
LWLKCDEGILWNFQRSTYSKTEVYGEISSIKAAKWLIKIKVAVREVGLVAVILSLPV